MKTLLGLIIIVIVLGIPALLIFGLIAWFCSGREYPKIKLSEFIKLYYADKENWSTYEFYVQYREKTDRTDNWYGTGYNYYAFRFGYFEFLVYICWYYYNEFVESRDEDKAAYEAFRKVVYKEYDNE